MSETTREDEVARLWRQRQLVEVNRRIRSEAAEAPGGGGAIDCRFVCECGDEACTELVVLSPTLYDDLKANEIALLADQHPLSLARRARNTAKDLRAAADALRAQSQLQVARARRLRSRLGDQLVVGVHLDSLSAASDLASYLGKPVALVGRADGVDVIIEASGRLGSILRDVRDWARLFGLEAVRVSFRGETRTLSAVDSDRSFRDLDG
jgi:hypothetical protein